MTSSSDSEYGPLVHADDEQQRVYEKVMPLLRPLDGAYCSVYRPSLTDSKIRSGSLGLIEQYKLVPSSQPKRRPWIDGEGTTSKLHLSHQLWQKDQGWLCFQTPDDPACRNWSSRLPRLGVQLTVSELEGVDPAKFRWSGQVSLILQVSMKETLGLDEELVDAEKLRAAWPGQEGHVPSMEYDSQLEFLKQAFGLRFYNLIQRDPDIDCTFELSGPKSFSELTCEDGVAVGCWDLYGIFYCPVDLSKFPYDVCSWDVLVSIIGWSPGLTYDWSSLRNLQQFQIFGLQGLARASDNKWFPYACEQNVVPNLARTSESFLYCRFHSRRKPHSILMNIILPIGMVTLLSTIGVWQASGVDNNAVAFGSADPLSFISTSLLTVVAMKFAYADLLPSGLSGPTLLDKYIFSCLLLLVGASVLVVACSMEDLQEFSVALIYGGLTVMIHIVCFLIGHLHSSLPVAPEGELLYPVPHETEDASAGISNFQWRLGFSDAATECRQGFMKLLPSAGNSS